VIISGDVRGYLEPCGCSEHMLGGLDRAAGQVVLARKELGAALHVNAGDSFFAGPALDDAHAQQDQAKARAVAKAFAAMQTAAAAVGPRDLSRGAPGLASAQAPFPLLDPAAAPAARVQVVEQGGVKLGLVSGADAAQLAEAAAQARTGGAQFVIALVPETMKALVPQGAALAKAGVDLAVAGHQALDVDGDDDRAIDAPLPLLAVRNRGRAVVRLDLHPLAGAPAGFVAVTSDEAKTQELGRLDAEIDSLKKRAHLAEGPLKVAMDKKLVEKQGARDAFAAERPAPPAGRSWFSYRFVPLSDEKPSDPAVKALIEGYTVDVGQLNLAWAKEHGRDCPAPKKGQAAFVGTATCAGCHAEPADVWAKTGHAHAFASLVQKHKQYDLDCVRCHVIGVDAPGGVCRVDKVAGKENVGCESCHGAGSLHADNPSVAIGTTEPAEATCRGCHTPENSTGFDYMSYLPRILGPGHGKPSAK
jgi:hypothetical protein